VLRSLGVHASDVDDAFQEVFVVIHRRLRGYEDRGSLRAWVYGICVRVALRFRSRRGAAREIASDDVPDPVDPMTPAEHLDEQQARRVLHTILDELDDDKRAVFVLFELEELSMQEVAQSLECPIQTAERIQMSREPTRLSDLRDPPSPEAAFMRGVIRAQRRVPPPEAKMQELAGRLGPLLEVESSPPFRAMPWLGASVATVVFVAAAVLMTRPSESGGPPGAPVTVQAPQTPSAPPAVLDCPSAALDAPSAPPAISVDALPSANIQKAPAISVDALPSANVQKAPAISAPRCDEVELVDRADTKLRSGDAAGALAVTREHEQRCPAGVLVQERERIAIEGLAKLGRVDAARARALAFEERFPSSPHIRRVRQVIERLPQ
jgi:RNA polymerase sigma-70 factor, ECF subfamily